MNKKLIISLGLVAVISTTMAAYADSTIYTDGIGRMHFLGRDAENNVKSGTNYSNSVHQDLTRKLYEQQTAEGVINDTSYDQHPLKNYENTFPDSTFTTSKYWKTKYSNGAEDAVVNTTNKTKVKVEKGQTDYTGLNMYGSTILNDAQNNANEVKTKTKKHWWNRK